MAVSQTIFRSFVQIPVITLCVLGLVGCPGSDGGNVSNGYSDDGDGSYIEITSSEQPNYSKRSATNCVMNASGRVFNEYFPNSSVGDCFGISNWHFLVKFYKNDY